MVVALLVIKMALAELVALVAAVAVVVVVAALLVLFNIMDQQGFQLLGALAVRDI